jgi:hypothetical protein
LVFRYLLPKQQALLFEIPRLGKVRNLRFPDYGNME